MNIDKNSIKITWLTNENYYHHYNNLSLVCLILWVAVSTCHKEKTNSWNNQHESKWGNKNSVPNLYFKIETFIILNSSSLYESYHNNFGYMKKAIICSKGIKKLYYRLSFDMIDILLPLNPYLFDIDPFLKCNELSNQFPFKRLNY